LSIEPGAVDCTVVRVVVRLRIEGVGDENVDDAVAVVADGAHHDLVEACTVLRPSSQSSQSDAERESFDPAEW
jgi:hypothetical protein